MSSLFGGNVEMIFIDAGRMLCVFFIAAYSIMVCGRICRSAIPVRTHMRIARADYALDRACVHTRCAKNSIDSIDFFDY